MNRTTDKQACHCTVGAWRNVRSIGQSTAFEIAETRGRVNGCTAKLASMRFRSCGFESFNRRLKEERSVAVAVAMEASSTPILIAVEIADEAAYTEKTPT